MYYIEKLPSVIEIGRVGEKNFREVQIDMSAWIADMPDGVPSLVVIRPGDSPDDAYVAATTFDSPVLTWVVSESDTGASEGTGSIQIWLEQMNSDTQTIDKRGKSTIVAVRIDESLDDPSGDVPAPQTSWMEQMTALGVQVTNDKNAADSAKAAAEAAKAKAEEWATGGSSGTPSATNNSEYFAEQAASSAEAASESASAAVNAKEAAEAARDKTPYIDSTTGNWMVWNASTGAYVNTGVEAQGPQGDPGQDGEDGTNGVDGINAFVYIRYSLVSPTQDSDMQTSPGPWIGICSTSASTAPTTYTSYTWYKIKGETGTDGQDGQDGQDGIDGTNAYVYIKYSANQPTQDSDMKNTADAWMGIYSGSASSAPTTYTSYTWYKIKGETGSVDDVYGDTIPITEDAATTVKEYVDDYMLDTAYEYDEEETYDVGEYCWYDGLLRRCIVPITTPEAWTSAHWSRANVTEEIKKLNDLQSGLDIVINGNKASENVTAGQYVTVRNSTISGITDGVYKAASTVASGTAFTSANLTPVTSGALNDLSGQIAKLSPAIAATRVVKTGTIAANGDVSYTVNDILSGTSISESKMVTIFSEGMRPTTSWDEVRPFWFYNRVSVCWGFHNIGTGGTFECTFIVVYRLY